MVVLIIVYTPLLHSKPYRPQRPVMQLAVEAQNLLPHNLHIRVATDLIPSIGPPLRQSV